MCAWNRDVDVKGADRSANDRRHAAARLAMNDRIGVPRLVDLRIELVPVAHTCDRNRFRDVDDRPGFTRLPNPDSGGAPFLVELLDAFLDLVVGGLERPDLALGAFRGAGLRLGLPCLADYFSVDLLD